LFENFIRGCKAGTLASLFRKMMKFDSFQRKKCNSDKCRPELNSCQPQPSDQRSSCCLMQARLVISLNVGFCLPFSLTYKPPPPSAVNCLRAQPPPHSAAAAASSALPLTLQPLPSPWVSRGIANASLRPSVLVSCGSDASVVVRQTRSSWTRSGRRGRRNGWRS